MSVGPLLSVIIVAYKSCAEIEACLASIPRTLLGGSVEVVVVDNSPGEGTGGIVRERFSRVKYLAPEMNLGFGRANNLGYAHTNPASEFVLFLNPDTVCNEAALAHCASRLRDDPTIGLISPKLVLADGSMDLACRRSIPTLWDGFCRATGLAAIFSRTALFSGYNLTHLPENGTYDVGAINGAFMLGRRVVFEAIAEKTTTESIELRAESEAAPLPLRPRVEDENLKLKGNPTGELKADSLALVANRSSVTAAGAQPWHIFDERFFMYGDDLDLCLRFAKARYRIVYDGSVSVTHLKGVSVAKAYEAMSQAIFDANRDVYLKHFNPHGSRVVRWKFRMAFGLWKRVAMLRARRRGRRSVRPM